MRSLGFTLILTLLAILVCGLAGWQWKEGNFNSILGAPPVPLGERLYSAFTPGEVKHIQISRNGVTASFDLGENGWQATQPWLDRMDPRAAVGIINFTLGLRVEDFAGRAEINEPKAGLRDGSVHVRLEGKNHTPLARYKMGRVTPWLATVKDIEKPVPTVFIQPRDEGRKRFIYACTGDISPLFKDSLKFLRDHRPFYFNPITLQKIHIRAEQGELTLGRETPQSPWRVVKPLDLATDPAAIKSLIEGLYELQAVKISDRASVTLPTHGTLAKSGQIALTSFGSNTESVLEIFPNETAESRDVRAAISDRPNTIFELPLKPEPNLLSLADLPLAINDLRDATLTNLNIQSLRGILIQPATGAEILISRTPPQPWTASIDGQSQEANEERLFTLLKAVTEGRAIGFETDAATDFTPWGLHRPFLKLSFLGKDNQAINLAFGIDGKGGFFANRLGTPTVMRVDQSLVSSIAVRPYEWRPARLWSLDRVNLMAIDRKSGTEPPLMLRYDFNKEEWTASRAEKDITPSLDPARANYLLGILEGLKVNRWLSPDDESAAKALLRPTLVFKVIEKSTNDTGDFTGLVSREITLAPGSAGENPAFYYGRLNSDAHPFLLDRDTYGKLATDLFEKE
ncbi:MAG: hypothetical protein RLZZ398_1516 [Verrucomicrobiota bacterium]|jgi:hypothetical protein